MLAASRGGDIMLTLYSYPELFGVADNNGYGLKVFAFLRLAGVAFRHEHIFDASSAPRGQLPYIVDDGETIGDSDTIIAYLIAKYRLTIDAKLTGAERDTDHLITRMLDDLYWVMSYSRWKDERYWPLFADALKRLPARRDADQHRRRHLWLHRQYPFLRHRYAAQAVRLRPRQPRAPLQRNSCGRDRAAARGTEVRMIGAASGSMLRQAAPCATLPATGAPMSHVTYRIVRHDEGWAYMVNGVFSEPFPTHDAALAAARTAAAEQRLPGHTETIEYEDEKGHWHTETAAGSDRPDTDVEDTN